jgi:hypothetical protein
VIAGADYPRTCARDITRLHAKAASLAGVLAASVLFVPAHAAALEEPQHGEASPQNTTGLPKEAEAAKSEAASRVAEWVASSGDNGTLPYIIIDKEAAVLFLFDAAGKPLGKTPVLIGVAHGDDATPGVGSKNLANIGPAERTTPAGRFIARYGVAAGGQRVLWVDYATSVALHPVVTGNKKERRLQRLVSSVADDNRITFGCINVPSSFYRRNIRSRFRKNGGVIYITPDTKPLEDVFPRLRVQPFINSGIVHSRRSS